MTVKAALAIAWLIAETANLAWSADFQGVWIAHAASEAGLSTAKFVLFRRGRHVFGTFEEDGGHRWEGCLKGRLDGTSVRYRTCYSTGPVAGSVLPECPSYGAENDKLTWVGGRLRWDRLNAASRVWEPYKTLRRQTSRTPATLPVECR